MIDGAGNWHERDARASEGGQLARAGIDGAGNWHERDARASEGYFIKNFWTLFVHF